MVIKHFMHELCCVVLCCVAHSYLDYRCYITLYIYSLHLELFILLWVTKLYQRHELDDKVFY